MRTPYSEGMTDPAQAPADLEPFVCADEARLHLAHPFGLVWQGREYLAASDGHTAALVHAPGQGAYRAEGSTQPPPLDRIIDTAGADLVGIVSWELDGLRALPTKWNASLSWGREVRLSATTTRGSGKRARTTKLLDRVPFGGAPEALDIAEPAGIGAEYLLRAVDFIGTAAVAVWRSRRDARKPWYFAACGVSPDEAPRLAVVMPVRL